MFILIFATIIILFLIPMYFFYLLIKPTKKYLPYVEAGPTEKTKQSGMSKMLLNSLQAFENENGEIIDISKMKVFIVKGECMKLRDINRGDIVLAKSYEANEEPRPEDILLIELHDEKFDGFKLRICENKVDDSKDDSILYRTYYYSGEDKHYSKNPHLKQNIKGKVCYVFENPYI